MRGLGVACHDRVHLCCAHEERIEVGAEEIRLNELAESLLDG
jgi:hypothetical protein